jgi:hypothetical protein
MKWFHRRPRTRSVPDTVPVKTVDPGQLWWVRAFTDVGRPLVAVVVLVLCAPGEQHLASLAGWNGVLSWGWAGLLAAYAGIAAVVATVRPKGTPGKWSAVLGAVVALLMAMGAQPVSHLFVTGWLSASPRAPYLLVIIVSCVPPLIFGHLLHLAATPGRTATDAPDTASQETVYDQGYQDGRTAQRRQDTVTAAREPDAAMAAYESTMAGSPFDRPGLLSQSDDLSADSEDVPISLLTDMGDGLDDPDTVPDPDWPGGRPVYAADPDNTFVSLPRPLSAYRAPDEPDDGPGTVQDMIGQLSRTTDLEVRVVPSGTSQGAPDTVPDRTRSGSPMSRTVADTAVPSGPVPVAPTGTNITPLVRDYLDANPDADNATVRTYVRTVVPDAGTDSIRKAITRTKKGSRS